MKTLLCVLKVREIERCIASYEAAPLNKVYIQGYKEVEIESLGVHEYVVEKAKRAGYTHLMMISDDATINNHAVTEVLRLTKQYGVGSAFCRLDYTSEWTNLASSPPTAARPRRMEDYNLIKYKKLPDGDFQTYFTGFALTCMPIELWEKYPFQCFYDGSPQHNGSCSDYRLSVRLNADKVPIWTNRSTEVIHEKEKINTHQGQTLLIGPQYREIIWQDYEG